MLAFVLLGCAQWATAADWPPISPADLALKTPRIDPNADAEALLWDVRMTDSTERELSMVLEHHVRLKIFTDRGREAHSTIELPYTNYRRVRDVEGRTVFKAKAYTLSPAATATY